MQKKEFFLNNLKIFWYIFSIHFTTYISAMSALIWNMRRQCREPQFRCKWAATVDCFTAYTGNRIQLCNSRAGRGAAFNQLGGKKKIKLLDGERSRSAARSFSFIFEKGARDKRGTEERNKIKRVRAHNASRTQDGGCGNSMLRVRKWI